MTGHERFEELAAGHALNALEPEDEQAFLAHFEGCAECRRSLAEFSEVAAGLALGSTDEGEPDPPARLWESIAAEVSGAEDVPDITQRRAQRRSPTAWLGAAAAVVLVAAGVIGWQVATSGSSSDAVESALSRCQDTSGCRVVRLTNAQNTDESAYLFITGQHVEVATDSLPTIDAAQQTYVLWQMPQAGRPVGVLAFAVTAMKSPTIVSGSLTEPYADTAAFAISQEDGTVIPTRPSAAVVIGAATSN